MNACLRIAAFRKEFDAARATWKTLEPRNRKLREDVDKRDYTRVRFVGAASSMRSEPFPSRSR